MSHEPAEQPAELQDFQWVLVRFCCHFCERRADARLAVLAWHYGAGRRLPRDMAPSSCSLHGSDQE